MNLTTAALVAIERVHAVTAWSATLALFATPFVREARRALAAAVTFALLLATSGLGVVLDQPYRQRLRQHLFIASPSLGWTFERKEHAAFAALLLAGSGLAALLLARRARARGPMASPALNSARIAWTGSALLALAAAVASAVVARRAHF